MSSSVSSAGSPIQIGHVIGARFAVEEVLGQTPTGAALAARDQKTKKPVLIRLLAPTLFATAAAAEVLRTEIRLATTTTHERLGAVYGTGSHAGSRYVASERLGAGTLTELIGERRRAGDPLELGEAISIALGVLDALGPIHARGSAHGAVRPSIVHVEGTHLDGTHLSSASVKLDEAGLARAILGTAGAAGLGADTLAFIAPELRAGPATPSAAADVFGMGGVLYALLCLRHPSEDFLPPSSAHPDGTPALDAILLKCLAPSPEQRFASLAELRTALEPFAATSAGASVSSDEFDVPLSFAPPATEAATQGPSIPRPPMAPRITTKGAPAAGAPVVGQRISLHEEFRPSLTEFAVEERLSLPAANAPVDLGSLLKKISENDAPRWMAQKDGLDHGPFSGRELVELIAKGDLLGSHGLLNMDTGERRKVEEWPDFTEFAEQHRLKRAAEAESKAIAQSAKVESRSNVAKFLVGGAVIAGLALIIGVFLYTRSAEQAREVAMNDLADLYARGDIEIEGAAGILPDPPPSSQRAGSGGRRSNRGGGGGGGGRSYEDAMAEAVDMGDATGRGGEGRLSPAQVAGVMNGQINSMFGCVSNELRSGRSVGRVRIDLAIAGSGRVLGSSVRAGSSEFQRCIQGRVAAIHFPSFGAPRMGASYSFDASR